MCIVLDREGKDDILKRASFLKLSISEEQLNGSLEVVKEYPTRDDFLIIIPRCFQRLAISKKFCSIV
jgi:hypothetical protein